MLSLSEFLWPDASQGRQPQGDVELDPYWVDRGLVLVVDGGRWFSPKRAGLFRPVGSCKKLPTIDGVVSVFGSTLAGDTTSHLTDGPILTTSKKAARSYVGRLHPLSYGGGSLGRIWADKTNDQASPASEHLSIQGVVSTKYQYSRLSYSSYYNQYFSPSSVEFNKWVTLGFSHDQSVGQIQPVGYRNGVFDGLWSVATANGASIDPGSIQVQIGNRASDVARSFDGYIGIQLWFDGFLTAQEHAALHANPWQVFKREHLPSYSFVANTAKAMIDVAPYLYPDAEQNRQPQGAVEIDWSNPITRNLVFSFEAFAGKRDLVSGATGGAVGSGVTRGVGIGGVKYDFSGSQASGSFDFGVHHGMDGAKSCTFDILVYFNSSNPSGHFFGQWDGFFQEFLLSANGSGGLVWVPADGTGVGVTRTRFDGTGLFTTAGLYRIIASWRGGTDITVLVNGVDKTSSFSTVSSSATEIGSDNTSDKLQLGMVSGGSPLNGSIYFARCWRTGKSKVECVSLSKTPWQIFKPRSLTISTPAAIVTVQTSYPVSDLSNSGWYPSTGTVLADCVNETTPNDSTYMYATTVGAICELAYTDLVDPAVATGHMPTFRLSSPSGNGITIRCKEGAAVRASWTYYPPATVTEYTPTLTAGEANSITDYTNISFEYEAIL